MQLCHLLSAHGLTSCCRDCGSAAMGAVTDVNGAAVALPIRCAWLIVGTSKNMVECVIACPGWRSQNDLSLPAPLSQDGDHHLSTYRTAALAALPQARQQLFASSRRSIFATCFQFNELPGD